MLLCTREVTVARREIDVDEVRGCEVWESEAGVEHEVCMFHPFGCYGRWEECGKAANRVATRMEGIDG